MLLAIVGGTSAWADPTAQDIPGTLTLSNSTINPNNAGKTGLNNDGTATSDIKHNGTITFVLNNTTEQNYKISFKACTNRAAASVKFTLSNGTTISERTVKIDNTGWNYWRDYACYTGTIPVSGSVSLVVTFMDGSAGTNNTANIKDVVFTALTTDADRMMQIPTDNTHPFDLVFATTPQGGSISTLGRTDGFKNGYTATAGFTNTIEQYYKISFKAATNQNNAKVKFIIKSGDDVVSDGAEVAITNGGWSGYNSYECYTTSKLPTGILTLVISTQSSGSSWTANIGDISFTALDNVALDESESYTPEAKFANVTLTRSITANKWSTIVLPFDIASSDIETVFGGGASVAELSSGDASTLTFTTTLTGNKMKANQPYAIKVTSAFSEKTIEGVTIVNETPTQSITNWNFVGTYSSITVPEDSYYFKDNDLWKAGGSGTTNIKPFRAYLTYTGGGTPTPNFVIDGDVTGIAHINADGQINLEEGAFYNLNGQRVSQPTKGLYIVNGKKVILK